MSEYIICKGKKPYDLKLGIVIVELDCFMRKSAKQIWNCDEMFWTIRIRERDIDFYLTKAQREVNTGIPYEETEFFAIISELLKNGVKIAMWYDIYCEELPVYKTKKEVLDACYNGIIDISGMCEVYFMME